jgi:hypothetical protein
LCFDTKPARNLGAIGQFGGARGHLSGTRQLVLSVNPNGDTLMRASSLIAALAATAVTTATAAAQSAEPTRHNSIAIEADAIAYGLPGYSGIINVSLANGFQIALGTGKYEVPSFLLKGDANYDVAKWKATSTSVQVLRTTYRFRGPMKSGPALGVVVLNQNWKLRSDRLSGETKFRPISVGLTGGYYVHLSKHFYVYPTTALTYNNVASGTTSVQGVAYKVSKFGPNASVHVGWAW